MFFSFFLYIYISGDIFEKNNYTTFINYAN